MAICSGISIKDRIWWDENGAWWNSANCNKPVWDWRGRRWAVYKWLADVARRHKRQFVEVQCRVRGPDGNYYPRLPVPSYAADAEIWVRGRHGVILERFFVRELDEGFWHLLECFLAQPGAVE